MDVQRVKRNYHGNILELRKFSTSFSLIQLVLEHSLTKFTIEGSVISFKKLNIHKSIIKRVISIIWC